MAKKKENLDALLSEEYSQPFNEREYIESFVASEDPARQYMEALSPEAQQTIAPPEIVQEAFKPGAGTAAVRGVISGIPGYSKILGALDPTRTAEDYRKLYAQSVEEFPSLSGAGSLAGGIALPTPSGKVAAGGKLARAAIPLAKRLATQLGYGAIQRLGEDKSLKEAAAGTLEDIPYALGGEALGGAAKLAAKAPSALRKLGKKTFGEATPEARKLIEAGVEDLTLGQMSPRSPFAQVEEVSQSMGLGVGPSIKGQREQGLKSFQEALIEQVRPESKSAKQLSGNLNERLAQTYQEFNKAYKSIPKANIKGKTISNLERAFKRGIDDPNALASAEDAANVKRFMDSQRRIIEKKPTTESMLKIRSNVRAKKTDALQSNNIPVFNLLQNTEDSISRSLKKNLPEDAMEVLSKTDAQYGKYKILEDTLRRAKNRPEGFTPSQLATSIQAATSPGVFARGGGKLRDISRAGSDIFETRSPATGARLLGLGDWSRYFLSPAALIANSQALRPRLSRQMLTGFPVPSPGGIVRGLESIGQIAPRALPAYGRQQENEEQMIIEALRNR